MKDSRKFLSVVIASGLDFDILSPEDVIKHVTMDTLAHHLPAEFTARLLTAGLQAKAMTASLILDTLGLEDIAEYVPVSFLWGCVSESATRALSDRKVSSAAPVKTAEKAPAAKLAVGVEPKEAPIVAKAESAAAPTPVPAPQLKPAVATRKPNRSAQAAVEPTSVPPPVPDPADRRMETPADNLAEKVSCYEEETSVGSGPVVTDVEYGDDVTFGAEGDEVTAFGQE